MNNKMVRYVIGHILKLETAFMLIPLALRGVKYRPVGASALLRRNLLIYGLGGMIAPFIGIKIIDMIVGLCF